MLKEPPTFPDWRRSSPWTVRGCAPKLFVCRRAKRDRHRSVSRGQLRNLLGSRCRYNASHSGGVLCFRSGARSPARLNSHRGGPSAKSSDRCWDEHAGVCKRNRWTQTSPVKRAWIVETVEMHYRNRALRFDHRQNHSSGNRSYRCDQIAGISRPAVGHHSQLESPAA